MSNFLLIPEFLKKNSNHNIDIHNQIDHDKQQYDDQQQDTYGAKNIFRVNQGHGNRYDDHKPLVKRHLSTPE